MLLAIDVGNTNTVLGLFKQARLLNEWRMRSGPSRRPHDLWVHVRTFMDETGLAPRAISGVVISSVIPRQTVAFGAMARKYLHTDCVIISGDTEAGIRVLYDDPSRLGSDRLCAVAAAYAKFGGPAIVIDFGTATTFDVLSKRGEYLGGVIAPGVESAAAALSRRTAKLPPVELECPERVIGTNTVEGMQSGIMFGALDAAEGIVRRIKSVIGKNAKVIATGGYAQIIATRSTAITHVEPSLVLEGARLIYELAAGRKRK